MLQFLVASDIEEFAGKVGPFFTPDLGYLDELQAQRPEEEIFLTTTEIVEAANMLTRAILLPDLSTARIIYWLAQRYWPSANITFTTAAIVRHEMQLRFVDPTTGDLQDESFTPDKQAPIVDLTIARPPSTQLLIQFLIAGAIGVKITNMADIEGQLSGDPRFETADYEIMFWRRGPVMPYIIHTSKPDVAAPFAHSEYCCFALSKDEVLFAEHLVSEGILWC